jgi:hypothetical protein
VVLAEATARRPTAVPMKLAAAGLTAAPTEETEVQLPIPAGPFAESTFSPSYSLSAIHPLRIVEVIPSPGASRSGLRRPSPVGPRAEK